MHMEFLSNELESIGRLAVSLHSHYRWGRRLSRSKLRKMSLPAWQPPQLPPPAPVELLQSAAAGRGMPLRIFATPEGFSLSSTLFD
jgi:hypothetical protein